MENRNRKTAALPKDRRDNGSSKQKSPDCGYFRKLHETEVQVEITDNGPGIPSEEIKVLTREREVEPLYHGSGLGLWLVNWIVRRSNGAIQFEENDPRRSVVTIDLPGA